MRARRVGRMGTPYGPDGRGRHYIGPTRPIRKWIGQRSAPGTALRPVRIELRPQLRQRVFPGLLAAADDGRPRTDVVDDRLERPVRRQLERRRRELGERKRQRAVAVIDQAAFGRPVSPDAIAVERPDDGVDGRIDAEQAIGPQRHDPVRPEHAPRLRVEAWQVEPVGRLRHRQQVDDAGAHRQTLSRVAQVAARARAAPHGAAGFRSRRSPAPARTAPRGRPPPARCRSRRRARVRCPAPFARGTRPAPAGSAAGTAGSRRIGARSGP